MSIRVCFAVSTFSLALLCADAAEAQPRRGEDRLPARECSSALPYSIRVSNAGGEIQAKLTANALEGILSQIPVGAEGQIGGEYIAGAIGGTASTAYSQVLAYYTCRSHNRIVAEVNAGRMTEDQLTAFDNRAAAAEGVMMSIRRATLRARTADQYAEALENLLGPEGDRIRSAMETPLDAATRRQVSRALGGIQPTDFTRLNRAEGWARIRVPMGQAGACGGVVTGVLEGEHAELQTALSFTPTFYASFFGTDANAPVGQAENLIVTYAELIKNAPPAASVPEMTSAFRGCALSLLERLDPSAVTRATEAAAALATTQETQPNPSSPVEAVEPGPEVQAQPQSEPAGAQPTTELPVNPGG